MLEDYLKTYRIKNNLTQKQMAEKLNSSQGYYSHLETGKKKPGMSMINRIAKLLNLKPSSIVKML